MLKNKLEISIRILFILLGILLGFLINASYIKTIMETIDVFALPIIVGASSYIAFLSFNQLKKTNRENRDMKSRYIAFNDINNHVKHLEKYRKELDEIFIQKDVSKDTQNEAISFTTRFFTNIPISSDEVHDWVCKDKKVANELCKMTKEGSNIVNLLRSIINTYEIISSGILGGILHKELALEIMGPTILKNYSFFKEYIKHLRDSHGEKDLGIMWEKLCEDI